MFIHTRTSQDERVEPVAALMSDMFNLDSENPGVQDSESSMTHIQSHKPRIQVVRQQIRNGGVEDEKSDLGLVVATRPFCLAVGIQ
jgi:hypothetical protein